MLTDEKFKYMPSDLTISFENERVTRRQNDRWTVRRTNGQIKIFH